MTPIKRSRRLQAGLAGLSVISALGAAVGLGLTTKTHTSTQASHGSSTRQGSNGNNKSSTTANSSSGPVTQPSSTPQATTSGS